MRSGALSLPARSALLELWRHPLAKLALGGLMIMALLTAGYRFGTVVSLGQQSTISVSDAEVCLRQGEAVYFSVTLGTEEYLKKLGEWDRAQPRLESAQAFVLAANSHIGSIRELSLDNRVFLRGPDGLAYPASGRPVGATAHHNTWVAFFPKYDMQGLPLFRQQSGSFDVLIRDVGSFRERVFTFRYPLPALEQGATRSLASIAMLLGAAMAALLITCTPCLVGSLAVGSLTMGVAWGPASAQARAQVRRQMMRKTAYYLAALAVVYTVIAMGVNALQLRSEQLRPVEILGGAVLLALGLGFLRTVGPVGRAEGALVGLARRLAPGLKRSSAEARTAPGMGPDSSSAMGASLAMVCSAAGAPTLTAAVILPLMIYAGLTDLYWALLVLAVYLAVCAVPFFLIAVGLGELLQTATQRWRTAIMVANSLVLVGLGLLLLLDPQAVADTLALPARLLLSPLRWIF
ncbi:MAG: hypothetical protein HYY02_08380 [Chloroflexi bacterium]|nr:hypothetical protein [Chloroflexota bacterium]